MPKIQMPDIQGLLGSPIFNAGVGLLSAGGRQQGMPQNTAQRFAQGIGTGNQLTGQFQQMQAQRDALSAQKRKQEAMQKITGLLSNPAQNVPAAIRAPGAIQNQQAQLQGLLSQAAPEEFAKQSIQSLLSPPAQQRPQTSTKMADFIALGGNPQDMAAFQAFSNPPNPSKQLADQLAALQIEANLADKAEAARLSNVELRTQATGRDRTIEQISSIVGLMEDVEGTAIQPGIIAQNVGDANQLLAAVTDFMGGDSSEARKRATQFGTLNKGFDRLVNSVLPTTFTNSVFEFIKGQNMGVGQELGTNAEIMKSTLKQVLDDDFNSDGDYDLDKEAIDALIVRLDAMKSRALGDSSPPPGFVEDQ